MQFSGRHLALGSTGRAVKAKRGWSFFAKFSMGGDQGFESIENIGLRLEGVV